MLKLPIPSVVVGLHLLVIVSGTSNNGINEFDCAFTDNYPNQYVAFKTTSKLVMDGKLDEDSWRSVPFTDNFVDISTSSVPKFTTQAKILWDDTFLYIGAVLEEQQVWANISSTCHCINPAEDQVIFHDNDFEISMDPDGSNHFYKEFEMNAYNATWDLILNKPYSDGGYENSSRVFGDEGFDMQPPLICGVSIDGGEVNDPSSSTHTRGWSVEVAIPLSSLVVNNTVATVPPTNGTFWRINFSRVEWHVEVVDGQYQKQPSCQSCEVPGSPSEDNWVWSSMGEVNMHAPEKWGLLQFSTTTLHSGDSAPATEQPLFYDEWPIRSVAMTIYHAEHAYFEAHGYFTSNITSLNDFASPAILATGACSQVPVIKASGDSFLAQVTDRMGHFVATIRNDRLLTVDRLVL